MADEGRKPHTRTGWQIETMQISATYVCPVRGMARLEPPEPIRLGRAAEHAKGVGIERLLLPILEASLLGTSRARVGYLDGLIRVLDKVEEAGITTWCILPAQRILGMDWPPPYLVSPDPGDKSKPVFLEGRLRNLKPFDWWKDLSILEKRIRVFREAAAALLGHPALTGCVLLDRALDWITPELQTADLLLKSYVTEIRERDEDAFLQIGLRWSELLAPETATSLCSQVDGIRISGLEDRPSGLDKRDDPAIDLTMAVYIDALAQWLFERPAEVEVGWEFLGQETDFEDMLETVTRLSRQGVFGLSWLNLVDPDARVLSEPPWSLRPGLERVGLLDRSLEPKERFRALLEGFRSHSSASRESDFIDIGRDEYTTNPETHFRRLWDHFLEAVR